MPRSSVRAGHTGGLVKGPDLGQRMRRLEYALALAAAVLATAGALSGMLWLLGIGAWALIAAALIEMIYRP